VHRRACPRFGSGFEQLDDRVVPAIVTFAVNTLNDTAYDHISTGQGIDAGTPAGTPVDVNGQASLRDLIQYGNANPLNGVWNNNHYNIDLTQVAGGTITLTQNSTLTLATNFNFLATAGNVTVVPNPNAKVPFNQFDVISETESHFTGMTLANGQTKAAGGAIWDDGTVQLEGCTFTNNSSTASDGGALVVLSGASATASNCIFENNSAAGNGGAIAAQSGSLATSLSNCTLTGNSAVANGGAVSAVEAGALSISGGSITENKATGAVAPRGFGGGVYVESTQVATISQVNIGYNTAAANGGGLYVLDTTLTMTDGQLSDNTAADYGGGFYVDASELTVTLNQVSVTDNTATTGKGGGGYIVRGTLAGALTALTGNAAGAPVLPLPGIGWKTGSTATITAPAGQQPIANDP
jgi:predicted outer membrane repeat protein